MGLAYNFRGAVHHHHGRKHGSIQACMVLDEPRVPFLDPKAARRRLSFHSGQRLRGEHEGTLVMPWIIKKEAAAEEAEEEEEISFFTETESWSGKSWSGRSEGKVGTVHMVNIHEYRHEKLNEQRPYLEMSCLNLQAHSPTLCREFETLEHSALNLYLQQVSPL